jgi:hypothetical protein
VRTTKYVPLEATSGESATTTTCGMTNANEMTVDWNWRERSSWSSCETNAARKFFSNVHSKTWSSAGALP